MKMESVLEDVSLKPLVQEDFDPKSFAAQTIQSQMVGEMLGKLAEGITSLDKELYSQVVTNYEDLLSQATGIEALESVLKMMQTRIESLRNAVERISSKIIDPYQKIVTRTAQLTRLQAACDLLRKVIRMLYLIKRLKSQMQGGTREITKVAQTFSEIDQLTSDGDLVGVGVVEEERAWLTRARREVESQAKRMLLQGLELLNPTQVGVSLQVFYNLGQLSVALNSVLSGFREALQHESQNTLDPATLTHGLEGVGPGRSTLPPMGSSASWKASLWTRLERLVNEIIKIYKQVHQLHIVLHKKKDPVTQVSFLETIAETEVHHLLTHFWEAVAEDLGVELSAAAQASIHLRQTFESDYPKLVRVFSDLLSQLEQLSVADNKPSPYTHPSLSTQDKHKESSSYEAALLKALSPFEKAYITRSQSRLLDSVNQLFGPASRGGLPREEEILRAVKTFTSELATAGGSGPLATIISKNVDKAVRLFNMKCDEIVGGGREAVQVSGPPNHTQMKNISITNTLHLFHSIVNQQVLALSTLHQVSRSLISQSVEGTQHHLRGIVSPLVTEVGTMLERMVESMHSESYSGDVRPEMVWGTPDAPCSGFMKEMQSFTGRIHAQHLSKYHCKEELSQQLHGVCERVLDLYVRHVCLLRPLEEAGKMRVTTDMAQIELALAPFCQRLSDLGPPYRKLRALRRLLFAPTEQLSSDEGGIVGNPLPHSYVLNFLFSRAPSELKSPHQVQGWTEKEYADWMDRHSSESERLAFIQATLDTYTNKMKGQGHTHPASMYGTMVEVLKKGFETL